MLQHNAKQDGQFYFGVTTTGIYCRPSCPARRPLRKNVKFYETPGAAERDGLRPCLRCRPLAGRADEATIEKVQALCHFIEQNCESGDTLTLETLAAHAGWSPFHLQRTFKAVLGISPKQWLDACRVKMLKTKLRQSSSVTAAVYDAGFNSSSRVYEHVDENLGMTPAQYRQGGKDVAISYAFANTRLGLLLAAATDRGLCFVQFGETPETLLKELRAEYPQADIAESSAAHSSHMAQWIKSLTHYLAGQPASLDLPLDLKASVFQLKVWRYLQTIPPGEVRTYGEVARAIGDPGAARAVGTVCGANKVALVIPCHRVIRGDQGLGGYRWGMERKKALLEAEKKRYTVPLKGSQ